MIKITTNALSVILTASLAQVMVQTNVSNVSTVSQDGMENANQDVVK